MFYSSHWYVQSLFGISLLSPTLASRLVTWFVSTERLRAPSGLTTVSVGVKVTRSDWFTRLSVNISVISVERISYWYQFSYARSLVRNIFHVYWRVDWWKKRNAINDGKLIRLLGRDKYLNNLENFVANKNRRQCISIAHPHTQVIHPRTVARVWP